MKTKKKEHELGSNGVITFFSGATGSGKSFSSIRISEKLTRGETHEPGFDENYKRSDSRSKRGERS